MKQATAEREIVAGRPQSLIKLGFSPCPNDCFMFDAMIHDKVDTEGLAFEVTMADVEKLNRAAFDGTIDITKISFHAYAHVIQKYVLLHAGAALGEGVGPLLVKRKDKAIRSLDEMTIAIPGRYTTANFLLSLAFPQAKRKIQMVFSEIEEAVLKGKADAGLLIHENRFTYESRGLELLMDLGNYWESLTRAPIPLGGIVVKRHFSPLLQEKINRVMRRSVEYAFANPESSMDFVKAHAQEMDTEVMKKHIGLYVNNYSVDLGEEGRNAVTLLFKKAVEEKVIESYNEDLFIKI